MRLRLREGTSLPLLLAFAGLAVASSSPVGQDMDTSNRILLPANAELEQEDQIIADSEDMTHEPADEGPTKIQFSWSADGKHWTIHNGTTAPVTYDDTGHHSSNDKLVTKRSFGGGAFKPHPAVLAEQGSRRQIFISASNVAQRMNAERSMRATFEGASTPLLSSAVVIGRFYE